MRMHRYLAATVAAVLLTASLAVPASADPGAAAGDVMTYGSSDGPNIPDGDTVSAGLKAGTTATFFSSATGSTGITCTVSIFAAVVTDNPPAPGTATESVTTHTFPAANCTENILGVISVHSIVVDNLPYNGAVDSATKTVTVTGAANPIQTTIMLNTILGRITCVYRANNNTVTGTTSNPDNAIIFTAQQFNRFSGPGTCFANGYFTATYAPVVDESQAGNPLVFVN